MACIEDLAEARAVLHQLRLGAAVVRGSFEGEAIEYTPASIDVLARYVRDLESECGGPNGEPMPRGYATWIY